MSTIKKPIQPNKPNKPSEPIKPEEFGVFQQPLFYINPKFYMDYYTEAEYYGEYSVKASLSLDAYNALEEGMNKFKLEHPNASDVKIDMVNMNIQYKEYGPNVNYASEMRAYDKRMKSYNQKMVEYEKHNEKYLVELKEYNELKLQYDLDQARINLKQLEKKANLR